MGKAERDRGALSVKLRDRRTDQRLRKVIGFLFTLHKRVFIFLEGNKKQFRQSAQKRQVKQYRSKEGIIC